MTIDNTSLHATSQRVAQSLATVTKTAATGTGAAAGGAITSTDFLSLLVTEMKNQDPTQPTDPNAYIQQLVGVNSLQQLIGINQQLHNQASSGVAPKVTSSAAEAV